MKKTIAASLLLLAGCSSLPDTTSDNTIKKGPQTVKMIYIGAARASSDEVADPINGCRVYAFTLDSYTQTAILCRNGQVTVGSSHHQKSNNDAIAALSSD